jgi:serine protease Do
MRLSLALLFAICLQFVQAQEVERAIPFVPQIKMGGGSYIGVTLVDIDEDRANALKLDSPKGAEVTRVREGSPAEKAGIKVGDVLLAYNGEPILGGQQLGRLVWETPQGRRVKLQYWRDGKAQETSVVTCAPQFGGFDSHPDLRDLDQQLTLLKKEASRIYAVMDIPVPLIAWKNRALGIECEPLNPQFAEFFGAKQGVLVRSVEKGSAAQKAGLKAGDVLTAVGERSLDDPRDLSHSLHDRETAGKPLDIAVVRNHKRISVILPPLPQPE